jgi:hypothetical protein
MHVTKINQNGARNSISMTLLFSWVVLSINVKDEGHGSYQARYKWLDIILEENITRWLGRIAIIMTMHQLCFKADA